MIIDEITNKNDEWYTPAYAVEVALEFLSKNMWIWLPFDTNESEFYKVLKKEGFNVRATHIEDGDDFFEIVAKERIIATGVNMIISNPPYSKKNEVLQTLIKNGVPFMMLMGCVGLMESKVRFDMFKDNELELLILDKRVDFINPADGSKKSPPFSSWYVCSKGVLPSQLTFRTIDKKRGK